MIGNMRTTPDHDRLFDEICGKLAELSSNEETTMASQWSEKIEKMHSQLKRTQDDLKTAKDELHNRIGNLENIGFIDSDLKSELEKTALNLEQERLANSKLNSDLAKSLELNLKLQFEIEEVRARANQILNEEKKHNSYLMDRNKSISHELELSQALCQDTRMELMKAKDKFQEDQSSWTTEKEDFNKSFEELQNQFEGYSTQSQDLVKNLSDVAEKKIIELKMALDKKSNEAQGYYGHLQQQLNQVNVLKQENTALKEYISKMTALPR